MELEFPAPINAIGVCVSKHQSPLIGEDGEFQINRRKERPEDLGQRADERKLLFA